MNKLFIVNIVTIAFLFLCLIDKNGSTVIYEREWGDDDLYYPINSNGDTCFVKNALYYNTSNTSPTIPISLVLKDADPNVKINQINSNTLIKTVFEITKTAQPETDQGSTLLFLSESGGSSSLVGVQYYCKSVSLLSGVKETVKSGIFAGQYYLIIRFKNIDVWDYNLIDDSSSYAFTNSKSLGNNYFLIPLSKPLFRESFQVKINAGVPASNPLFNANYPYSMDATSSVKQKSFYPSNENVLFTGMGVGIITVESNEESLFIQTENSNIVAIKIGGSFKKGVYMLQFSNLPQKSTYTVRIQNGDTLSDITKSFNHSIITNPYNLTVNPGIDIDNDVYTTVNTINNIKVGQSMKSFLKTNTAIKLFDLGFPFGYIGGTSSMTSFSLSVFEHFTLLHYQFGTDIISLSNTYTPVDTDKPVLMNFNLVTIDGGKRLLYNLLVSDPLSGVKNFQTKSAIYPIGPYLVAGNQFGCLIEIDVEFHDTDYIRICDNADNCLDTNLDSYMFNESVQPATLIETKSPKKLLSFPNTFKYLEDVESVSFKYNQLNVTGKSTYNVMTIKLANFPNAPIERTLLVRFYPAKDNPYAADNTPVYYARYNSDATVVAWQCEFIVPANIGIGELQYSITLDITGPKVIYSDSLGPAYQLNISDSQQYDFIGPIVTASSETKEIDTNRVTIGWLLTIEDSVNGYIGNGYLLIRGSIDMTVRNITTGSRLNGNIFKGDYRFSFSVSKYCISQTYSIVYAKFIDSQGWVTEFDESIEMGTMMNPFYPLLDQINIKHYNHECNSSLISVSGKTTQPTLSSFSYVLYDNKNNLNALGTVDERIVIFTFKATHEDGIILNPPPTIYLTSTDQETIYSIPNQVVSVVTGTTVEYTVIMEIPYGFGYAKGILISVFGIVSNAGIHAGFTSKLLKNYSFSYKIDTTFSNINSDNLILTGTSQLSSNGGILWLYGKQLNLVYQLEVTFSDGTAHILNAISPSHTIFSVLFPPTDKPVTVRAKKSNTVFSNKITIQPFLYNDKTFLINPVVPETPSPTPTVTPTPSNILCKSTCGISNNQGYCSTQGYCICNSPYIGSDCSSTIIIIAPPVINETQPSTEIKIPNEEIKYSSIVSIVSIRELNFQFDQVYSYTFEKWVYTSILDSESKRKYSYFSNITNSNNQVISNITVILEWNSIETTVEFAGQPITLLPSSIKYTIELSEYPFSSDLNSLQLIMSTSIIKSSNNDECLTGKSNSEFGNSSSSTIDNQNNSDSNYIELKVDNYIFYGRFIKRALLDNKPISVSNTKLSDDNVEVKIGSSSSKIGINIPWYESKAIIDPDFSLLIQSNTNEDDNCSDNGLTSAQLAGIIVGAITLFIILVIVIFAIIYKSSRCFAVKILVYKFLKKSKQ